MTARKSKLELSRTDKGGRVPHSATCYLLSDVLATLQVMISIRKDLRLHNWNNTILRESVNLTPVF